MEKILVSYGLKANNANTKALIVWGKHNGLSQTKC